MKNRICAIAAALSLGMGAWALSHETTLPGQSSEFQQVRRLAGKWKGTAVHSATVNEKPGPVSVQFKVTAGGSVIEETLMPGTPHEMVDMYVDESGKLAMTHYCSGGNQPHMVLKQAGSKQIRFEMGPTPGIDPKKDMHMHALTLEFPDADHLTERWVSHYADGKEGETVFTLTRVGIGK